jgi:hypothetical protein
LLHFGLGLMLWCRFMRRLWDLIGRHIQGQRGGTSTRSQLLMMVSQTLLLLLLLVVLVLGRVVVVWLLLLLLPRSLL